MSGRTGSEEPFTGDTKLKVRLIMDIELRLQDALVLQIELQLWLRSLLCHRSATGYAFDSASAQRSHMWRNPPSRIGARSGKASRDTLGSDQVLTKQRDDGK